MHVSTPAAQIAHHPRPTVHTTELPVDQVLSRRARRRLAALLKLHLLELHEEHLDHVRAVIEREMDIRKLFDEDGETRTQ